MLKLDAGNPADIEPILIRLKPDVIAVRAKYGQWFKELKDRNKERIDDFILLTIEEVHLLRVLRPFLEICRNRRLIVSILKSDLYLTKVTNWGHIIYSKHVRLDPKKITVLKNCDPSCIAGEICEYVHHTNWIIQVSIAL